MVRAVLGLALLAGPAGAQPLRFKFSPGQELRYAVRHTTAVAEGAPDGPAPARTATRLDLTKRWKVARVAADGTATVEMTVTAVRQQIARPGPADKDGRPTTDVTVIDSSTPTGREQTAAYLNKPIVTLTVDPAGRVTAATAPTPGAADRLAAEPPFRLTFPDAPPAVGGSWERPFVVTLTPPAGTGERFHAVHTFTLKSTGARAVIGIATALKSPPEDPALMPALVPLLWEGEAYFDPAAGRYLGAKLRVKKEVANHQGAGSTFAYESEYTEEPAD